MYMAHLWNNNERKENKVLQKTMLVPLHPPQIPQGGLEIEPRPQENECPWNVGGMILTGENRSTWRESCPSDNSSNTNIT
jgi:hypothetical protein